MTWRDFLQAALSEDAGQPSSIRLQMFICCVTVCLCLLGLVAALIFGPLVEIPAGFVTLLLALLGIVTGAKVIQYPKEPANQPNERDPQ